MLSRQQAESLLDEWGAGASWMAHCEAVADAAERIALAVACVRAVDVDAVRTFGLLHDIGRYATHDPVMHGVEGHRLLSVLGHDREAYVCAAHILFGMPAQDAARFGLPETDFVPRGIEERIVTLADFLVEFDRPTTLEARFTSLRERNPHNAYFLSRLGQAYATASETMSGLAAELGVSVEGLVACESQAAR